MKLIFYCHGYAKADIIADLKYNEGESSIKRQLIEAIKNNAANTMENIQKNGDVFLMST